MSKHWQNIFLTAFLLLCLAIPVWAGTTGKLAGTVKDAASGENLVGASVTVIGTKLGAASDLEGSFYILNVPSGTYDLNVSMVGYKTLVMRGVKVFPDLTRDLQFRLESTTIQAEQVEITATRPLIEKDITASTSIVTSKEIRQMPIRGFQAVTRLQAGTVSGDNRQGGGLQIRGGRPGEVAYYVDGFSTQNYITGGAGADVNSNAIQEVMTITGGFSAEYGNAMSGIVNVVTREAGEKRSFDIEVRDDEFMPKKRMYGYRNLDFSAGLPFSTGTSIFLSGEYRFRKDRAPRSNWDGQLMHMGSEGIGVQLKVVQRISDAIKAKVGAIFSKDDYDDVQSETAGVLDNLSWRYNAAHMPRYKSLNYQAYLTLTANFSKSFFGNFSANYFYSGLESGDGLLMENYNDYLNTVAVNTTVGPDGRPDTMSGDRRYDSDNLYALPGVSWRVYRKRQSEYIGGNFDLTKQLTAHHELKLGGEIKMHTARYFSIDLPWRANPFIDNYDEDRTIHGTVFKGTPYKPVNGAVYLQDKMELEGAVVNAGLRFDFFNAAAKKFVNRTQIFSDQAQTIVNEEDAPTEYQVSPRLGFSFPVTDMTLVHFNYGHFFQPPQFQFLYEGRENVAEYVKTGNARIGDPGLAAERTIATEIGVTQQLGKSLKFDVTGYLKNISGLVDTRLVPAFPYQYVIYDNMDYGTVRGIDFSLEKRRENYISGRASYSIMFATGSGSYQQETYYDYITSSSGDSIIFPRREFPLDFDQRHTFNAVVDVRDEELKGMEPFKGMGLNVIFRLGSGLPFTPRRPVSAVAQGLGKMTGGVNSGRMPWTYQVDLKWEKTMQFTGWSLVPYLEVINLFDTKNAISVYDGSGRADDDAYLPYLPTASPRYIARYRELVNTPLNYGTPLMVRLGLSASF